MGLGIAGKCRAWAGGQEIPQPMAPTPLSRASPHDSPSFTTSSASDDLGDSGNAARGELRGKPGFTPHTALLPVGYPSSLLNCARPYGFLLTDAPPHHLLLRLRPLLPSLVLHTALSYELPV